MWLPKDTGFLQARSRAQVFGLDGDQAILAIAREKASRSGVAIALPYADLSFDRVLSTLVMSLLNREEKTLAIREAYRVLRNSGEIHIDDFGQPQSRWGRLVSPLVCRFEPISDNLDGFLPVLFHDAGKSCIAETRRYAALFGTISIGSGRKPDIRSW